MSELECGHHESLLVKSIESDYQYCQLFECHSRRRDAELREKELVAEKEAAKQKRIYYQDIVYEVCNQIDRVFATKTVCGTSELPTQEVQKRIKLMLESRRNLEQRIQLLERTLNDVLVETNFISLGAARDYISEVLQVGPYAPTKG